VQLVEILDFYIDQVTKKDTQMIC